MHNIISQPDITAYHAKELNMHDLCYKYQLTPNEVRKQLSPIRQKRTNIDRKALADEIRMAVPYDKENGLKAVLARWGINTITHALQITGYKTLAALREDGNSCVKTLRTLQLKLAGRTLSRNKETILLTEDDYSRILSDAPGWIRANLDMLKRTLFRPERPKAVKTRAPKAPKIKKTLLTRFHAMQTTYDMLKSHHTVDEITHAIGTPRYTAMLRPYARMNDDTGWINDLFTDVEITALRAQGEIV